VVVGLVEAAPLVIWMLVWFLLWVLYLSIVNIGQTFYAFGWESLLLEAGFFAIFLGPAGMAPPLVVIWMFRWLLFRVEFAAGVVIVVTQGWLVLSGNFSWLNAVTIVCAVAAFNNDALSALLPRHVPTQIPPPGWYEGVLIGLTVAVLILSYWPARNLLSRR